ncbi:MAG TPA: MFS transporter [Xanthobacteraceae bacterium]|nr:MFS transporter [Xanthobacteraceae bacterium]
MSSLSAVDQLSLLHHRDFRLYWLTRISTTLAYQMMFVAVGWQIYELTGSAFNLGLVGLILFIPALFAMLVAGHVADTYDRRRIVRWSQIGKGACAAALALGNFTGILNAPAIFAIVFALGACRMFDGPTMNTLIPSIVPMPMISRAVAAGTTANQMATICGPALGGFLYVFGPAVVYTICFGTFLLASSIVGLIHLNRPPPSEKKPVTLESIFAGFNYMRRHPILLGAVSLDLCAVLLGGVIALLPVFARDILETGPWGLGLLRSAPAVGAVLVSGALAHLPLQRHVGRILTAAIIMFGLSVIAFGLSRFFLVSLAALMLYGACNSLNVVVRHSLVQTRTPNDTLGRVMAVSSLFSSAAETLGQFESGVMAALLGVVPSVLVGGAGAIGIALLWTRLFPDLWRVQSIIPEK